MREDYSTSSNDLLNIQTVLRLLHSIFKDRTGTIERR